MPEVRLLGMVGPGESYRTMVVDTVAYTEEIEDKRSRSERRHLRRERHGSCGAGKFGSGPRADAGTSCGPKLLDSSKDNNYVRSYMTLCKSRVTPMVQVP